MIRQSGPPPDRLADLPELLCEFVEAKLNPITVEKLCSFLEALSRILHGYAATILYARNGRADQDDLAACKRAMRLAMEHAFTRVGKK